MTDEQVPAETTADASGGTETSTAVADTVDTVATDEVDRGDLRVPLKEERTKRQELESSLNDPDFIYQRARELGLTAEEVQEAEAPSVNQPQRTPYEEYQYFRSLEKAQEKYPELQKDEDLQVMVTALINRGMNPEKAADKVFAKIQKANEEAKKEGAAAKEAEITEKEKAQLASSSVSVNSDAEEMARLQERARSLDPRIQKEAKLEILKRRMK